METNLKEGIMGRNVYVKRRRTKKKVKSYNPDQSMSEEEDMAANCLILLAQGRTCLNVEGIFNCKTCNRDFPSFQALGGHRTSHKRLKSMAVDDVVNTTTATATMKISFTTFTNNASGDVIGASVKSKVHECSICGLKFSSGQALGGHMRRHRPLLAIPGQVKKEKILEEEESRFGLDLDLNLPAPSDDDGKISFVNRPPLIFSSLGVNFHY